jgi:hypothetical protein
VARFSRLEPAQSGKYLDDVVFEEEAAGPGIAQRCEPDVVQLAIGNDDQVTAVADQILDGAITMLPSVRSDSIAMVSAPVRRMAAWNARTDRLISACETGEVRRRSPFDVITQIASRSGRTDCGAAFGTGYVWNRAQWVPLMRAATPSAHCLSPRSKAMPSKRSSAGLDSADDATVVWPKSFSLVRQGGELRVRQANGRELGRIGGAFRLGGGEVPYLHDGIALSAADCERGQTRCPGKFWIVGEVS